MWNSSSCSWIWVYLYWVVGSSSSSSSLDLRPASFSVCSMVLEFERLEFHVDYLSTLAWNSSLDSSFFTVLNLSSSKC